MRARQSLLRKRAAPAASAFLSGRAPTVSHATSPSSPSGHAGHSFSGISVVAPQPKHEVSQPGDHQEVEADAVADRVMRLPADPGTATAPSGMPGARKIHRKCAECEAEEEARRKKGLIQRKCAKCQAEDRESLEHGSHSQEPEDLLNASSGQPLDAETRAFMEPRFGHAFSQVRVHTDARAAASARALNARAYTLGPNIVLGAGQYAPETMRGKHLLAHELTHVIQQGYATRTSPDAGTNPREGVSSHRVSAPPIIHASQAREFAHAPRSVVQRWPEWLNFSSDKCTSERWNCRAAWLTLAGVIAATIAAFAAATLTLGLTLLIAAGGILGCLAAIAWGISAHKALNACLQSDPNADPAEKEETKRRIEELEKRLKQLEDMKRRKDAEDQSPPGQKEGKDAGAPPPGTSPAPPPAPAPVPAGVP
jgi:hypothetical protein